MSSGASLRFSIAKSLTCSKRLIVQSPSVEVVSVAWEVGTDESRARRLSQLLFRSVESMRGPPDGDGHDDIKGESSGNGSCNEQ
jgi:hypothetical protein